MKKNSNKITSEYSNPNVRSRTTSDYGDDNTPEIDTNLVDPLSEDERPRKDGPGGN